MRKIIIIASGILVFLILIIIIISRPKPNQNINNQITVAPTIVPIDFQLEKKIIEKSLSYVPYEDENFRFDYNPQTNQFIVQKKTDIGQEKFIEWVEQNQISELAANPELIVFQDQENNPISSNLSSDKNNQLKDSNIFIEFLDIILNLGRGSEQINNSQSSVSQFSNSSFTNQTLSINNESLTYFAQCDSEYADIPLPDGCNMCQAGCGAATVAMIASSYLGKGYDPQNIVNQYKNKGYLLSCAGSRYSDARSLLQSLGLKTTDYIIFDYETADRIVDDLKKYLKAGWTFFTLANFKENGGGHFFWITDIDEKGNILAYDPYYGRFEAPPINENSRYPFPKYRLAFGVKQ